MFPVSRFRFRRRSKVSEVFWTPAQLSTALWLDAADASTITLNGSTVSQWRDKSGNARNASQATAASQPAYSTSAINGKPAVVTDGVDDGLFVDPWGSVNHPFTRVLLFSAVTVLSNRHVLNSASINNPSANASNVAEFFTSNSILSQFAGTIANGVTINPDTNYIRVSEYDTINSRVYTTGTQSGPSNAGTRTLSGVCIGGYSTTGSGAPLFPSNVRFGEVLVIPGILSTADRQKLEGYMAWKWGGF